jgi:hypothetical protein
LEGDSRLGDPHERIAAQKRPDPVAANQSNALRPQDVARGNDDPARGGLRQQAEVVSSVVSKPHRFRLLAPMSSMPRTLGAALEYQYLQLTHATQVRRGCDSAKGV